MESYNELYHHGVKGMKWGVRRYRNEDGTLTPAGKKRQAKQDASDERYREKQKIKTANYYDRNQHGGLYGATVRPGINQLKKNIERDRQKYHKTDNAKRKQMYKDRMAETSAELQAMKALKKMELKKVKDLTHDDIMRERVAVGKSIATDIIASVGVTVGATALLGPMGYGITYAQVSSPQAARSRSRWEKED